ncbi:MAG TPA: short-chain dehydrogenase [Treponema sp.]|nr:MAG: hypothetical protein A2001_02815 [Treponema sp. GWC1_61_84]HCM25108.1 short-chain dehydrogenase [Treponema sp.]
MNVESNPGTGIALVTGASSGIGAAFARALARTFARASVRERDNAAAAAGSLRIRALPGFDELWLVARRVDRLETLATELRSQAPALTVRIRALDLVDEAAFPCLAADLAEAGKPLCILINNAGYGTYGPFAEVDLERQLGQIDLNCRSLTRACGILGPALVRGSIVINTASLAAFAPLGGFAVYAASKAYVLSFSVALAAEWEARGIRVCALCPGSVASEFALVASGGVRKEVLHGWSSDRTAEECLLDAGRGKRISMPRFKWRANRFFSWLFGPEASARFALKFMKRPHRGN